MAQLQNVEPGFVRALPDVSNVEQGIGKIILRPGIGDGAEIDQRVEYIGIVFFHSVQYLIMAGFHVGRNKPPGRGLAGEQYAFAVKLIQKNTLVWPNGIKLVVPVQPWHIMGPGHMTHQFDVSGVTPFVNRIGFQFVQADCFCIQFGAVYDPENQPAGLYMVLQINRINTVRLYSFRRCVIKCTVESCAMFYGFIIRNVIENRVWNIVVDKARKQVLVEMKKQRQCLDVFLRDRWKAAQQGFTRESPGP